MSQVVTIDGASLLIHQLRAALVIEAYELARVLGYKQQSSLRKQILGDWKHHFTSTHYHLVHDVNLLREYEDVFICTVGEGDTNSIKPMKPERGRLFLTPTGVDRALSLTSKKMKYKVGDSLEEAGFLDAAPVDFQRDPEPIQAIEGLTNIRGDLISIRQHNYDVLQKLITQLQELQDPQLKLLAIEAAEIALGRKLTDLRNHYSMKAPPSEPKPPSVPSSVTPPRSSDPEGPVFKETGFYGLKQIGEMAGGYTSVVAGKAANKVAEEMGYTAHQIRSEQLEFNELPMLPDSTSGKLRKMYRFNKEFANEVIRELRESPDFVPQDRPMPLTSFNAGAGTQPKLNQGPFQDEDEKAPTLT